MILPNIFQNKKKIQTTNQEWPEDPNWFPCSDDVLSPSATWKFLDRVASIVAVAREEMVTNPGGNIRFFKDVVNLVINDD